MNRPALTLTILAMAAATIESTAQTDGLNAAAMIVGPYDMHKRVVVDDADGAGASDAFTSPGTGDDLADALAVGAAAGGS